MHLAKAVGYKSNTVKSIVFLYTGNDKLEIEIINQ